MLIAFITFTVLVAVIIYCLRSPAIRLQAIDNVRQLHKMLSVRIAALAGVLELLIPGAQEIQADLPQLEGVQQLHAITSSTAYQTAVALLSLFVIVARAIKQSSAHPQKAE